MPATRPSSDLILHRLASSDCEIKLKAIREVKNQIIGNRTKKLSYIKLGAVPAVATALAEANAESASGSNLIVQSAAALGSFACGVDAGVRAVLDAGVFPHLIRLLSAPDDKVVDAAARSLRMIYQSKLAPKYDFFKEENMEFLLSLLKSENENLTGLGASIVIHSCETSDEQNILCCAGALDKLISLLDGSISQRDSSLESLAAILKSNPEAVSKFVDLQNGRALSSVIELTKDRYSRTRLLACLCLICVKNSSSCYLQDIGIKTKLISILLELLDDYGQVGDDASFAFSSLVAEKEDLQKLAFEANAIDKFYNHLQNCSLHPKRLEGIFLALANLCSKLECSRSKFLSLQVLNILIDALSHDDANVRSAACICLKSVSRSIKNLSAGYFMNERIVIPLVQLLSDISTSVQVAALGAISNIVVDFTPHKSKFMQCGGIKELVQLTKSMDSSLRLNAVWALRNMVFLADKMCKEAIFMELTASSVASLICDPEPSVQEHALALVRNFVDGCMDCVEYAFAEDGIILDAVGRQLQKSSKIEIGIQGMYILGNIASGNESHKEAIMQLLLSQAENVSRSFFSQFLQSHNSHLRTSAVWVIVNLTFRGSPGALGRIVKLHNVGIVSQIKRMVNDPCMDVKLRAKQALGQINTSGSGDS
ncbi:armadillo repeat-containing protein 8-like [Abrus precatorius]|uniref:Armadillo repeat-containing protein 8-like n=1 Tax=Abrus precatorius TaxID=3816 RepID=A0A8B8JN09_ABRPR|nr:armadillo repeat-containing protein 8-like [Abrus precatorius]XP_027332044.1 armadillo repeat-containing protein 8-like [Abrus precatorius]XP_027332045.1 armadillo repeat-containing protein 8-like [Abrus precatorius]